MATIARGFFVAALALATANCSTAPLIEVQNDSRQAVRIHTGGNNILWGRDYKLAAGERMDRIAMPATPRAWRLRVGNCTYTYPTLSWAGVPSNPAFRVKGAKTAGKAYAVVTLDPELVLHVRLMDLDGVPGEDVLAEGLPARPVKTCADR